MTWFLFYIVPLNLPLEFAYSPTLTFTFQIPQDVNTNIIEFEDLFEQSENANETIYSSNF